MKRRLVITLTWLFYLLVLNLVIASGQGNRKTLTVWLIPLELAATDQTMDFDKFNEKVGEGGWVTVLNTTVQHYREQLIAWNPEFAYPNFPIIKGQQETLAALRRFAEQNQTHIYVRFVWWGQAFEELRAITEGKQRSVQDGVRIAPDVAQVGSTWVGYFAKNQALIPRDSTPDRLDWRDAPDAARASLPYTTDVRLIFYWKRMSYPIADKAFHLDSASWDTILSSLSKRPIEPGHLNPPMAMPIALTPNLLHDYAPLIWAGGGDFIGPGANKADLTSDAALAVPLKLMERATQPGEQNSRHRIIAFPEMSHEEAVHHFLNGEYLALIEPVGFIKRWKDVIARNGLPESFFPERRKNSDPVKEVNFWDYAGVAAPPRTFIGGSDLIVTSSVKEKPEERDAAFKLARFLATDVRYSATLAELGTLPAQQQKYGIDALSLSLKDRQDSSARGADQTGAADFTAALSLALSGRNEQGYPALAEWPDYIESREVLEAIQRIWRRIGSGKDGDGDVANLKEAAAEAELAINQRLHWRTKFLQGIRQLWWAIVIGMSTLLAIAINQIRLQRERIRALKRAAAAEKGRLLALRLYRAKVHEQLQAYGAKLVDFAKSQAVNMRAALEEYGQHIGGVFNGHLARTTKAVAIEMERRHVPMDVRAIVDEAYQGAEIEFKAAWASPAPAISLTLSKELAVWRLLRLPHLLIVILQEWFYNCLKEIDARPLDQPTIEVRVYEDQQGTFLRIVSPHPISEEKAAIFSEDASSSFEDSGHGIPLIRDILWFGFEVKASCQTQSNGHTVLSIPILFARSDSK